MGATHPELCASFAKSDAKIARHQLQLNWPTLSLLKQRFRPRPWTVSRCTLDLVPGGRFFTVMRSPEGVESSNESGFLEIAPNRKLVFTDALLPGYRPAKEPFFTAIVTFTPEADDTLHRSLAGHANRAASDWVVINGILSGASQRRRQRWPE